MSDWTSFGRVDADGTVYVKTAAASGSSGRGRRAHPRRAWPTSPGGSPTWSPRSTSSRPGSAAAPPTRPHADHLAASATSLDEAHVVGDIDGLAARLDKLVSVAEEKAAEARAARDAARGEALARKTALVEEAEAIGAESTSGRPPATGCKDDPRRVEDDPGRSTRRPTASCGSATRPPGTRSPAAAAPTSPASTPQRKQATGRKEELVTEAESLADSTEWNATANRLKELMAEWKTAPRARQGGRAAAVGAVPGRPGRVLRPPQRGLLGPRRRAEGRPGQAAGPARRGRGARRRRRPAGRAGQAARDPGPVARRRPGQPRRRRRRSTGACARSTTRSAAAMDAAWRRTTPEANPLLAQMREQVAEAEARLARAQAAGDAKRVREAAGGADQQASLPRAGRAHVLTASRAKILAAARQSSGASASQLDSRAVAADLDRGRGQEQARRGLRRGRGGRRRSACPATPRGTGGAGRPRRRRRPGSGGGRPAAPSALRWCGAA